jgi:hypothetical protein
MGIHLMIILVRGCCCGIGICLKCGGATATLRLAPLTQAFRTEGIQYLVQQQLTGWEAGETSWCRCSTSEPRRIVYTPPKALSAARHTTDTHCWC